MNYKNLAHPFNQKKKILVNPVKHWFQTKSLPKITLLSSRQTKNQPNKLQILPKRLSTKQSQIKTNKTTQIPKIFSFTVPSAALLLSLCFLPLSSQATLPFSTSLIPSLLSASLNCSVLCHLYASALGESI